MASKRALRALQASVSSSQQLTRTHAPITRTISQQQLRPQSSNSTAAIAYKAMHRRIVPLPTPTAPSTSPAAAVSNILYETPLPSKEPPKRHVLNCLVQNEPGVLSRISGILAARGFNIDSLVVCSTEVPDLSRMTIVLQGQDGVVEQARRQLEDLVPVWAVLDYTSAPLVQRELLLAKISILGPEYFEELLAHHREMTDAEAHLGTPDPDMTPEQLAEARDVAMAADDFHPSNLAPSEALRLKHQHLETITYLAHQFGGKVLDISTNNCVVELSAKPNRIDSFMKLIAPFGILESARTGKNYWFRLFLSVLSELITCHCRSDGASTLAAPWAERARGERGRGCGGRQQPSSQLNASYTIILPCFARACFLPCTTALLPRGVLERVYLPWSRATFIPSVWDPCKYTINHITRILTQSSPCSRRTPRAQPTQPRACSPPPERPNSRESKTPHRSPPPRVGADNA